MMDDHTFLLIAIGAAAFLFGLNHGQKQSARQLSTAADDPAKDMTDPSMNWLLGYGKL
jgi:hypothetical protein